MRYVSTRGQMPPARFSDVLLEGLAPDGGLIVPESYPQIDRATRAAWRKLNYAALATEVLTLFCDDIPRADLVRLTDSTYTRATYGTDAITPVTALQPGLLLQHLSNGPTLAFKDMAMQLLGALFEYTLAKRGEKLNVLGATSGDTGSAAEYAMRGRLGVKVFMLSPHGRMSAFQRAQMYSLPDANIYNIAIEGVFDECQDIVKAVSGDLDFKRRYRIGTVNSINWARVVAQVVYYFRGYFASSRGEDDEVDFCVPSGNFGNVLAGWIARQMGLPIRRLILATNENNVLDEFFRTGTYRVRGASETWATSSPSMDISKASNFERFVFDIVGRDASAVRDLWRSIAAHGRFDLTATPYWPRVQASGFVSGSSTHADRLATIRQVYESTGTIIDPHTADGVKVARECLQPGVPIICLETALPVKFTETIVEAIGREPDRPAPYADIESRPQRCDAMPVDVQRVKDYIAARAER
jgi:threonine synthase